MLCKNPFRKGVMEYGCYQCMPCRINRSRIWSARMLLELQDHENAAFVTLTYSDVACPVGAVLVKQDVQAFLKRLRYYLEPRQIRYFAVGEYGEQSWRPHYHLIIFGIAPTEGDIVSKAWTKGYVYMGTAEPKSIAYVCNYVLKNMRNKNDRRLGGRVPEFSCSSKRPGIGHGAVKRIAGAYQTRVGRDTLKNQGWFSGVMRAGGKIYPLGRYLKDKIQDELKLDKVSKKAYLRSHVYQVFARKSAQTTTEYERKRKAKVAAQGGRVRKQLQTL